MGDPSDFKALQIASRILRQHEGLRLFPYRCTAGKLTIGYGRNLEDVGISDDEAQLMLSADIKSAYSDVSVYSWWPDLSDRRKAVLIDMRFNLGGAGFRGFRHMLGAISAGDYDAAANEMLDSLWATQVGQRATTLAEMMRDG
jgi:lysozyme